MPPAHVARAVDERSGFPDCCDRMQIRWYGYLARNNEFSPENASREFFPAPGRPTFVSVCSPDSLVVAIFRPWESLESFTGPIGLGTHHNSSGALFDACAL